MRDLQIDKDGSFVFTNFDLTVNSELDLYVEQKLYSTLRMFKGEWYLNIEAGIPYFQDVLIKNPNLSVLSGIFKAAINSVDGVDEIVSFDLDYQESGRKLDVSFVVRLVDGSEISLEV